MMEIITIKYNKKSKVGKLIDAFLKAFDGSPDMEIVANKKEYYDPELVKKIRKAEKQKGILIDTDDIWGSIGLK